jgi:hypothetical protein
VTEVLGIGAVAFGDAADVLALEEAQDGRAILVAFRPGFLLRRGRDRENEGRGESERGCERLLHDLPP